MKKIIMILAILTLAVMASGCTDSQNTNKTYSANGITFIYPGDWTETSKSDIQGTVGDVGNVIVAVGKGDEKLFAIAKANLQSGQSAISATEWGTMYKSAIGSSGFQVTNEKKLTVDGNDAYLVTAKDNSGIYATDVYFTKNGQAYIAVYASKTNDQQILDNIINSLKIS